MAPTSRRCGIRTPVPPEVTWDSVDTTPKVLFGGYGMGLFTTEDFAIGRTIPYILQNAPCSVWVVREPMNEGVE